MPQYQLFYYRSNGMNFGPCSDQQLKALAEEGRILPTDQVRRDGTNNWHNASEIQGLFPNSPVTGQFSGVVPPVIKTTDKNTPPKFDSTKSIPPVFDLTEPAPPTFDFTEPVPPRVVKQLAMTPSEPQSDGSLMLSMILGMVLTVFIGVCVWGVMEWKKANDKGDESGGEYAEIEEIPAEKSDKKAKNKVEKPSNKGNEKAENMAKTEGIPAEKSDESNAVPSTPVRSEPSRRNRMSITPSMDSITSPIPSDNDNPPESELKLANDLPSPIRPNDNNVYYFNTTCIQITRGGEHSYLYIDSNNTAYRQESDRTRTKKKIMENVRSIYLGNPTGDTYISFGLGGSPGNTYYLITTNNELWAWGANRFGQVGDDTGVDKESPVLVMKDVANLYFEGKGRNSEYAVFALKDDKSRWGWGSGVKDDGKDAFAPIKVDTHSNHNQQLLANHISMQNGNPENYPLIELPDDIKRQLGGKDNIVSAIKYEIIPSTNGVDFFGSISSTAEGPRYYAVTKDGVLWGWGQNGGKLGDGTRADRDMPVKIAENVRRILPKFFVTELGDWYHYSDTLMDKNHLNDKDYVPRIAYKNCFYVYSNHRDAWTEGMWFTPDGKLVKGIRSVRDFTGFHQGRIDVIINDIKLPGIVEASSGQNIALVPKPFAPRPPEEPDNDSGTIVQGVKKGNRPMPTITFGNRERGFSPQEQKEIYEFGKDYNCNVKNVKTAVIDMDKGGETLLHKAAMKGNILVAKFLVSNGADVNVNDKSGETPLHEATKNHNKEKIEVAMYLVTNGANINTKDNLGNTPLHLMAMIKNKDVEFAKFLVSNGADVNVKDNLGRTPLHRAVAVKDENIEFAKVLVSNGADVNVKDKDSKTPFEKAKENGNTTLEEYLSQIK